MKAFTVIVVAVLAVSSASPKPENTITYADAIANIITEDLTQPITTPFEVDISKLDFMMYNAPNTPCRLTYESIASAKNCGFNPAMPTKVVTHGFEGTYNGTLPQIIVNALFEANDTSNIIVLGWKNYSSPYVYAAAAVPKIGESLGKFLFPYVRWHYMKLKEAHFIGHSLGAHVVAYAARFLDSRRMGKVGNMTGLDPANPLFCYNPPDQRISPNAAYFVEIFHTSCILGCPAILGKVDFFINGGCSQPQCANANATISEYCNHIASVIYLSRAIINPHAFLAEKCNTGAEAQDKNKALKVGSADETYANDDYTSARGPYCVSILS